MTSQHAVGYDGMWARPGDDPRVQGNPVGETAVLVAEIENQLEAAIGRGEDLSA